MEEYQTRIVRFFTRKFCVNQKSCAAFCSLQPTAKSRTQERAMAIDMREIVAAMGGEIGERFVHQKLADHLREEIAKGESSHDVVAKAIIRLRNSEFLQVMRGILGPRALGLSLTGLGAGIAKVLQTMNFEGLLPEDQSHIMREVRYVLQNLAPALIVGAIDGATDNWEQQVHEAVGKVRSDDRAAKPQKRGALDQAYEILSADGVDYTREYGLLFPEWDANGQLQHDSLGAVILAGPNGKRFAEDWYKTHKGGEKEVPIDPPPNDQNQNGRGKGNQQQHQRFRKIQVPPEPYKGRLVPLPVAITRLPASTPMDPELVALAKAALVPKDPPAPKDEKIDEGGLKFQLGFALTLAGKSEHEQRKGRDLLSDLAGNPSRINTLGKQFALADGVTTFTDDEIKGIYEYAQTWMGATLTIKNEIIFGLTEAKQALKNGVGLWAAVGVFGQTVGKWVLRVAIGLIIMFVLALALFLTGGFILDAAHPIATYFVLIGGAVMIVELLVLTPIQATLSLIQGLFPSWAQGKDQDWLVNKGRILITLIGIHVSVLMILIFLGVPQEYRLAICGSTALAIAIHMGLMANDGAAEAQQRTKKTLRWFGHISVVNFITVITLGILWSQQITGKQAIKYFQDSKILSSLIILAVAGFIVSKVVRRLEETGRTTAANGVVTEKLYRRNWWLRSVGIIFVLGLASWPWIGSDINARFEKKAPSNPLTSWFTQVTMPAPATVSAPQPIPQPSAPAAVQVNVPDRAPVARVPKRSRRALQKFDMADCPNVSYEWQQEMGCP